MKERPILFSSEMVNAILHGTDNVKAKTQTRRTKGLEEINVTPRDWVFLGEDSAYVWKSRYSNTVKTIHSPYGKKGDRLWVKETFLFDLWYSYKADYYENEISVKWKPAIHMPRKASRITLEIQNIRVQRLLEITDADSIAEGVVARNYSAKEGFMELWDKIHGKDAHKLNPFVWVIEFKRLEAV